MYRTRATINRGYYYFFLKTHVGFSLKFVGIPLEMYGYKRRAVINRARLIVARVRYLVKWCRYGSKKLFISILPQDKMKRTGCLKITQ